MLAVLSKLKNVATETWDTSFSGHNVYLSTHVGAKHRATRAELENRLFHPCFTVLRIIQNNTRKSEDSDFSYYIQLSNDTLRLENWFVCVVSDSLEPAEQISWKSGRTKHQLWNNRSQRKVACFRGIVALFMCTEGWESIFHIAGTYDAHFYNTFCVLKNMTT